jgi:hypothetical protein
MFTMCDPTKLKFMNFIAKDWGQTNVFNWSGGNAEFGVFFKASILPASII